MQTEQLTESETKQWRYTPVPSRPVISEPHIEDYLDHVCAPLIGVLSYEDRQRVREAKRQELETTIQAHIELGNTREEAIAATLLASTVPPQIRANPVMIVPQRSTVSVVKSETPHPIRRTAFAFASANALFGLPLILAVGHFVRPIHFQWEALSAAMAVVPAIAGCILGCLSPRNAAKSWSKACLLTIPLLAFSYFVFARHFWNYDFVNSLMAMLKVGTIHITVSLAAGLIGTWFGGLFRTQLASIPSESAEPQ